MALALAPAVARAHLVLDSGDVLDAPRYGFTPADAAPVSAPLVLTEETEWRGCPPEYVGEGHASRLHGALVIAVHARSFVCSPERHARAAAALGAAGWLSFSEQSLPLRPVPGYISRLWLNGDVRAFDGLIGADITSAAAAPLIASLRSGRAARGTLAPSSSAFDRLFTTWFFTLWTVVLALVVAFALEMAVSRLVSFLRADGRVRATIPQLMLGLEVSANGLRLAQVVLDPIFFWPGRLSYGVAVRLRTAPYDLSSLSTFLFLVYFCEASDAAGLVSLSIGTRFYRRLALLLLLLAVGADLLLLYSPTLFDVSPAGTLRLSWSTSLLPIPICAFALYAHRRARMGLYAGASPPVVLSYLVRETRRVLVLVALGVVVGPFWQPCLFRPWARLLQPAPLTVVHACLTVAKLKVFVPIGVAIVHGPLERAANGLAAGVRACVASSRAAQESPPASERRASEPTGADLPAQRRPLSATDTDDAADRRRQRLPSGHAHFERRRGRKARSQTLGALARSLDVAELRRSRVMQIGRKRSTPSSRRGSGESHGGAHDKARARDGSSRLSIESVTSTAADELAAVEEGAPKQPGLREVDAASMLGEHPLVPPAVPPPTAALHPVAGGGGSNGQSVGGKGSCELERAAGHVMRPSAVPAGSGGKERHAAPVDTPTPPRSPIAVASRALLAALPGASARVHPARCEGAGRLDAPSAPDTRGARSPSPPTERGKRVSATGSSPPSGGSPSAGRRLSICCAAMKPSSPLGSAHTQRRALAGTGGFPPHLGLGVSLAFLREFAAAHGLGAADTSYRAGEIVREITAASRLALCELKRSARTADGRAAVRPATLFVSHAQACSFVDMLDAVSLHMELHSLDAARTYLWIDLCCIRQHRVDADVLHIGAILRQIGRMVAVLSPWDKPIALTRVWCLYEIMQANTQRRSARAWQGAADEQQPEAEGSGGAGGSGGGGGGSRPVEFSLALSRTQRESFLRALDRDRTRVCEALTSFDARHAEASLADDRARILELIVSKFAPSGLSAAQLRAAGLERDPADAEAALDAFNATVRTAIRAAVGYLSWSVVSRTATAPSAGPPTAMRPWQRGPPRPKEGSSSTASRSEDWGSRAQLWRSARRSNADPNNQADSPPALTRSASVVGGGVNAHRPQAHAG